MCKKLICLVGLIFISQMVMASPIPQETPGLPELESVAYHPAFRPTIDGDLSDWIASEAAWKYFGEQKHVLRGDWGGPEDSSILWSIMWDDTFLYFAGVVWDDVYTQPTAVLANWQGDCVFLYFDADQNGERDNLLSLFLLEDPDDPEAPLIPSARYWDNQGYGPSTDSVNFVVIMDPNLGLGDAGTIYEAAIPLDELVNMTAEVGGAFNLNVGKEEGNDTAHDGGKFICWTNQEPGDPGNQFPVNFAGAQVKLDKAVYEIPYNGAIDVPIDAVLSWKAGKFAVSHDVYFGTNMENVIDANSTPGVWSEFKGNKDPCSYDPGTLDFGYTYYWRIDEVNDAEPDSPWKGDIWSFTILNYIVVEDFEDYNDYEPDTVWNAWLDGYGDPANGSSAGYPEPDFFNDEHYLEDEIVHGGNWSMPLFYDNGAGLSEVTRTLNADWTQDDVVTLTLFYYGDASNAAEPMYVALNGNAVVTNDDPKAALDNEWNQWDILLQEFADMGVNLANVNTMSIGFGNKANPIAGGKGHVFFDDIRICRSLPEEPEPEPESVDPGTDNLMAYYAFENNAQDGSGNGYNATLSGNPQYVSGPTGYGMAIELDGTGDYVSLPIGSLIESLTNSTIAIWVNWSGLGGAWQRIFDFGSGEQINMFLSANAGGSALRFAMTNSGNTNEDQTSASQLLPSGWHHVAVTIDPSNTTHKLHLDGKVVAQNVTARYTPSDLGETNQNWLGRSQYVADPYFNGSLDEFRIYNRALSEAEIRYLAGK